MDILITIGLTLYVTCAAIIAGAYICVEHPETEKLGIITDALVFIGMLIISPILMLVALSSKNK